MSRAWGMAAAGLIVGLLASCKTAPASGPVSGASDASWELKGSRLVGCCCSPPCS